MAETKVLKERRRRFVEAYMTHGNATQAAKDAGYAESGAKQEGCRLLTSADVRAAIRERIAADSRIATREERQWILTMMAQRIGRYAGISASDQQRAIDILNKAQGDYIERQEIREDVHYHVSWDTDPAEKPKGKPRR